jgi:hypothetical protein
MRKTILLINVILISSFKLLSQNPTFTETPKYVVFKSESGKAFEVDQQQIVSATYQKQLIDNPEYISRLNLIDSLQGRIDELQKKNIGGSLKSELGISSKKNDKEIEIEKLKVEIGDLKKDIPPKNSTGTYSYAIPKKIEAYIPIGKINRVVLIIDPSRSVSNLISENVFTQELSQYGGGNLYRIVKQDTLLFKKDELVLEDSIRKYFGRDGVDKLSVEAGYLYKREGDNSIFLFDDIFKNNLIEQNDFKFFKLLNDLGIVIESSDEHSNLVLVKDNKRCVLTSEIQEYLESNKNSDVIEKVNNSKTLYKNYLNQQSELTVKMTKYIQIHKSYTKLTSEQQTEWGKYTQLAIEIEGKIKKISFSNSIPYQLESKENQVHSANLDLITYSRNALGI